MPRGAAALDHVFFSETRAYMALIMGAAMAVVMLAFMTGAGASARASPIRGGGSW